MGVSMDCVTSWLLVLLRLPAVALWLEKHGELCPEGEVAESGRASTCVACAMRASRWQLGAVGIPDLVRLDVRLGFRFGEQRSAREYVSALLSGLRACEEAASRVGTWLAFPWTGGVATHLDRLFAFWVERRQVCGVCGRRRSTFEAQFVWRVTAGGVGSEETSVTELYLQSCAERAVFVECDSAACHGGLTEHRVQERLASAPNLLIVYVSRGAEGAVEGRAPVIVDELWSVPCLNVEMELAGVIFHRGRSESEGRYTSAAVGPSGGFWYFDDDKDPQCIGSEMASVLAKNVAIAVYQRPGGAVECAGLREHVASAVGSGRTMPPVTGGATCASGAPGNERAQLLNAAMLWGSMLMPQHAPHAGQSFRVVLFDHEDDADRLATLWAERDASVAREPPWHLTEFTRFAELCRSNSISKQELEAAYEAREAAVVRGAAERRSKEAAERRKREAVEHQRREEVLRVRAGRDLREVRKARESLFEKRGLVQTAHAEIPSRPQEWVFAYDVFVGGCCPALQEVLLKKMNLWSTISRWVQEGVWSGQEWLEASGKLAANQYFEFLLPVADDDDMLAVEQAHETLEEMTGLARLVCLAVQLLGALGTGGGVLGTGGVRGEKEKEAAAPADSMRLRGRRERESRAEFVGRMRASAVGSGGICSGQELAGASATAVAPEERQTRRRVGVGHAAFEHTQGGVVRWGGSRGLRRNLTSSGLDREAGVSDHGEPDVGAASLAQQLSECSLTDDMGVSVAVTSTAERRETAARAAEQRAEAARRRELGGLSRKSTRSGQLAVAVRAARAAQLQSSSLDVEAVRRGLARLTLEHGAGRVRRALEHFMAQVAVERASATVCLPDLDALEMVLLADVDMEFGDAVQGEGRALNRRASARVKESSSKNFILTAKYSFHVSILSAKHSFHVFILTAVKNASCFS